MPLAIFVIYKGGWLFNIVVLAISLMTLWEFYKITEKKQSFPNKHIGLILSALLVLNFSYYPMIKASNYAIILVMVFSLIIFIHELWRKKPNAGLNVSVTLSGIFYISLSFSFLILLRNMFNDLNSLQNSTVDFIQINTPMLVSSDVNNAWLVLCVLISIWICDTAAYFAGKGFGKHKLFERVSPKKTLEGAVAGLIFGILAFIISKEILISDFALFHSIIIGLIVGIFGQVGDLAESLLKRDAGIKDSSAIIPGHGGFLDRFDSILFVMPIVYIYLLLTSLILN